MGSYRPKSLIISLLPKTNDDAGISSDRNIHPMTCISLTGFTGDFLNTELNPSILIPGRNQGIEQPQQEPVLPPIHLLLIQKENVVKSLAIETVMP